MKIQTAGTLIGGAVQLDSPPDLPDKSRVTVSLEPVMFVPAKAQVALESFKELIQLHPIYSGGHYYTRDELHERR